MTLDEFLRELCDYDTDVHAGAWACPECSYRDRKHDETCPWRWIRDYAQAWFYGEGK